MKHFFYLTLTLIVGLATLNSCRESFDQEFRNPPILNNPPVGDFEDIVVPPGFGEQQIDMNSIYSDADGDPLTFAASSGNEAVATVSVEGAIMTITEVGNGTTTIATSAFDGEDEATFDFQLTIDPNAEPPPPFVFFIDFDEEDGTDADGLEVDGATLSFEESSDGSEAVIFDGALEWTTDEFSGMRIEFDPPIDLSENSMLQFDYADLWSTDLAMVFGDEEGNESEEIFFPDEIEAGDLLTDDPNWNTFTDVIFLEDFAGEVDLGAISFVYFEKFEATEELTWLLDNFGLGSTED